MKRNILNTSLGVFELYLLSVLGWGFVGTLLSVIFSIHRSPSMAVICFWMLWALSCLSLGAAIKIARLVRSRLSGVVSVGSIVLFFGIALGTTFLLYRSLALWIHGIPTVSLLLGLGTYGTVPAAFWVRQQKAEEVVSS